jgi:hypothetical protein
MKTWPNTPGLSAAIGPYLGVNNVTVPLPEQTNELIDKPQTIMLTDTMYKRIRVLAKRHHVRVSVLCRTALQFYMDELEKVVDTEH